MTQMIEALEKERDRYRAALERIVLKEGPYKRDPLTHAENTIDAMAEVAASALAGGGSEMSDYVGAGKVITMTEYENKIHLESLLDHKINRLERALRAIAKNGGPYKRDPYEHACGVLDSMANIATRALAGEEWDEK